MEEFYITVWIKNISIQLRVIISRKQETRVWK